MSNDMEQRRESDERLSALVDGELDTAWLAVVCGQWRDDAHARATWHSYQLIGDVLRSDDLASDAARDAAFLGSLRSRLAAEPVVLAPAPLVWPADSEPSEATELPVVRPGRSAPAARWTWRSSSAVAAGFVVVAGALVMTRSNAPRTESEEIARATPAAVPVQLREASNVSVASSGVAVAAAGPQALVANGQLIRDARLDRYLAAHKQFAGTSALGIPSAYLRSATAEAGDR